MEWSYRIKLLRQAVINFFGTPEWLNLFTIILYQISFLSGLYLLFFIIWNFVWDSDTRFSFTFAVQNKSFLIELLWYFILYVSLPILLQLPVLIIHTIIKLKLTPTEILIFMLQPHVLKIFVLTFILCHTVMFLILCTNLDNIERNFLFFELLLIFKLLFTCIIITLVAMHVELFLVELFLAYGSTNYLTLCICIWMFFEVYYKHFLYLSKSPKLASSLSLFLKDWTLTIATHVWISTQIIIIILQILNII